MMRSPKSRVHRERGQDLAEYAITLPIFLMLLVVIVDLGRITYTYSTMFNAAREAARAGIIDPYDTTEIENRARGSSIGLDPAVLAITINVDEDADTIEVILDYDFQAITPFIDAILPSNPVPLTTRATMQIER